MGSVPTVVASPGQLDNTVKVWDAVTSEETLTLKGNAGVVFEGVAFSPDGVASPRAAAIM